VTQRYTHFLMFVFFPFLCSSIVQRWLCFSLSLFYKAKHVRERKKRMSEWEGGKELREEEIVSVRKAASQGVARLFSDCAPSEGDQRRCRNSTPLPLPGSLTTNGEGNYVFKVICTPYVHRPHDERCMGCSPLSHSNDNGLLKFRHEISRK